MKNLCKILFCFALLAVISVQAQQLRFTHITSEQGLSTNFVSSVLQDDKGFMWFGTQDGLNKYDAYQFKIFKHDPTSKNSLSNSEITALKQLNKSTLLIGTKEGLNFFDLYTEKFSAPLNATEREQKKINAISSIDSSTILVGTDEGLFSVNAKTKKIERHFFKEPVHVRCIELINGTVYIGTEGKGLWQLNGAAVERSKTNLPSENTLVITQISGYNGDVYVSTFGSGIIKLNADLSYNSVISFTKHDENADYIRSFVISSNKIYGATVQGIVVYNFANARTHLYEKNDNSFSLNTKSCNAVFVDNESNLWVGTELGGVNISFFQSLKFPNSHFNYETQFENVYTFFEDKKGTVFLGSGSFSSLDPHSGIIENHSAELSSNAILCMAAQNDTILWIGTYGNGLYRYDKITKKSKAVLTNALGGTIVCLKIDGSNIYAGSVGDGLFKIDLKTQAVTRFTEKDGLPDPSINAVFKDKKGNVWLGTYSGGLVKMKGFDSHGKLPIEKIYSSKSKDGEIAANAVLSINQDESGNIWVATSTGLSKLLANGTFYNFYEKDGLSNTYLYSILKDSLANFWMSTNSGIIKFNPQLPEKEIIFKNYGVKDGLVNTEYNMGAAFVSASGNMYFGGPKGFNVFRPTAIKDNLHAPSAYVIGYKRGGKDVVTDTLICYKKHLKLSWRENYFQFELAALDYTDPSKNKFKYRLEGYETDWSSPTNVRYVSYTELPGGEYTFQVMAANNDGVWNEVPFEIKITVVPPFWKTKTFYFLVILLGMGGIIGFTQYRTRAIKKENKILENKVAERTHELAEKNHDITSSIQYAKRIQEAILPSRELIFKTLKKVFILYKPKDIVSGDFYWFTERKGIKIFAVVDCTGHGVPGAFMSMIGHNLLNQIVLEKGITDPADILNNLHKGIQEALRQGHNEINTNDGMDVSLITINDSENWVKWAGANRPLVVVNAAGELIKYDGNKFPVGGAQLDSERVFTTQQIPFTSPSMAYMTSDGYADQFGGEKGKKFMVKRYHELLTSFHLKSAEEQKNELDINFEQWKTGHDQVDDVLVVGIEI